MSYSVIDIAYKLDLPAGNNIRRNKEGNPGKADQNDVGNKYSEQIRCPSSK